MLKKLVFLVAVSVLLLSCILPTAKTPTYKEPAIVSKEITLKQLAFLRFFWSNGLHAEKYCIESGKVIGVDISTQLVYETGVLHAQRSYTYTSYKLEDGSVKLSPYGDEGVDIILKENEWLELQYDDVLENDSAHGYIQIESLNILQYAPDQAENDLLCFIKPEDSLTDEYNFKTPGDS
ncbi:MAG: hypothetical protein ACD_22C00185G0002 [uncultured bacterium]|nr:MAG: hypothetical protein ACD_22C00185G0002 [uncultured bacterium]